MGKQKNQESTMPITVRRAHVERGLPLASLAKMQAGKSKAFYCVKQQNQISRQECYRVLVFVRLRH
jgi:hypothetical protein